MVRPIVHLITGLTIAVGTLIVMPASVTTTVEAGIDNTGRCCESARRTTPESEAADERIVIIGDSLTVGVTSSAILGNDTIQARLTARGHAVTHDALKGRTMADGIAVVDRLRDQIADADIVMFALGTNNIWGNLGRSQADAEAQVIATSRGVHEINPRARIMWVELTVENVAWRTIRFNDAISSLADRYESIEVCTWRDLAVQHPEWMARDGVHNTTSGYAARRDVQIACLVG